MTGSSGGGQIVKQKFKKSCMEKHRQYGLESTEMIEVNKLSKMKETSGKAAPSVVTSSSSNASHK